MNLDLSHREDELYAPIEKRVKVIFERIGAEEGYDLIVDKKSMPTAKFTLDLTDRVIREYNWGPPGSPVASAAAPGSASAAPKP
jgi:Skp family chaperone for outer membrane proteins